MVSKLHKDCTEKISLQSWNYLSYISLSTNICSNSRLENLEIESIITKGQFWRMRWPLFTVSFSLIGLMHTNDHLEGSLVFPLTIFFI